MILERNPQTVALALASTLACLGTSSAVVTAGTAGGMALSVDVSVAGVAVLDIGPLAQSNAFSPGTLTDSATVLSLNTSVVLGSVIAANGGDSALKSNGTTDVIGTEPTGNSMGSSTINNLGITVFPGVLSPDFLNLTSGTIGSTSTSTGQFGTLGSTGTVTLENVVLTLRNVMINLESNPAPNTVIDLVSAGVTDMALLASLTITLNEQIATGDGSTMTGLTTNAIHIELTALDLEGTTGVVESDIIIGQSKSSLTAAIPEPGTLGLFAGLPLLALLRRRRQ